jgi:cathepsin L
MKTGKLLKLSEQQMIDCSREGYGNYGCGGGDEKAALKYGQTHAIALELDYPYLAID